MMGSQKTVGTWIGAGAVLLVIFYFGGYVTLVSTSRFVINDPVMIRDYPLDFQWDPTPDGEKYDLIDDHPIVTIYTPILWIQHRLVPASIPREVIF